MEVIGPDGPIRLPRLQQRLILGALAIQLNTPVSAARLANIVRGGPTASSMLTRISEVRQALQTAGAEDAGLRLLRRPDGYLLAGPESLVDAFRFRSDIAIAGMADSDQDLRDQLRAALALWRGPVLDDHVGSDLAGLAESLESDRLTAYEDLFEVEVRLGRQRQVLEELIAVSDANPSRERLVAVRLRTLQGAGRGPEALRYYNGWRRNLADELGVDPSAEVLAAYQDLLRVTMPGAAGDTPAFRVAVPRMLPHAPGGFTGRADEIAELTRRAGEPGAVVVVSGPGGVGKTALCLHVAHAIGDRFAGGQIFVDLRGGTSDPLDHTAVLARLLRALGVDGAAMPPTPDERADLYRSLVSEASILVVLDNASSAEQVLPLIPGGFGCSVIINSRSRLAGAVGGHQLELGVLPPDAAVAMLEQMVGRDRVDADAAAARDLAHLCGHLPLALRIAAARLAAKPHWHLRTLADLLFDERNRLDQLKHAHFDVRASIALSYASLRPSAQRMLRTVAAGGLHEVTTWIAAALLDVSVDEAFELLEELFDAQLMEPVGERRPGLARFRMHDLVYLFAFESGATDDSPEAARSARARAYEAWLGAGDASYRRLHGGDGLRIVGDAPRRPVSGDLAGAIEADAIKWFEPERESVADAIRAAAADGRHRHAWELAVTFFTSFEMLRSFDELEQALRAAIAVTVDGGDVLGEAALLYRLGVLAIDSTDYAAATTALDRSLQLFESIRHAQGKSLALIYLALVDRHAGRDAEALDRYRGALDSISTVEHPIEAAVALRSIGQLHMQAGDLAAADESMTAAVDAIRNVQSDTAHAQVLCWHSLLRARQGRFAEAKPGFEEALERTRRIHDLPGQAACLRGLGLAYQATGDIGRARRTLTDALRLVAQPRPTLLEEIIQAELAGLPAVPSTESSSSPVNTTIG